MPPHTELNLMSLDSERRVLYSSEGYIVDKKLNISK